VSTTEARLATPVRRRRRLGWLLAASVLLLGVVAYLSLAIGSRSIEPGLVIDALRTPGLGGTDAMVVRELRVPRTLIGLAAGAALGLAGTLMQGLTRNPIADPGILGISSGAALGVVLAISGLGITGASGYIWFALAGAAAAAVVVYGISSTGIGGASPVRLALTGSAITAAIGSILTLVLLSNPATLNQYRFWAVGSLAGRSLDALIPLIPFLLVGGVLALALGRSLNLLAMGEDVARGLGQNVTRTRTLVAIGVVLLAGTATALAGPIVLLGLAVPHIARSVTGPDYRWILAYSVVIGAGLLVIADIIGRLVVSPGELEVGVVAAFLGAPVMIVLVRRSKVSSL
jgi:iron complex transport system permease protein